MRCPKCSYISFDQVENCLKCGKPLPVIDGLIGTVYDVALPAYLHYSLNSGNGLVDENAYEGEEEFDDSPISFDKEENLEGFEEEREIEMDGFSPEPLGNMEIEPEEDDDGTIAFTPNEPEKSAPAVGGMADDGEEYGDFNFDLDLEGLDLEND